MRRHGRAPAAATTMASASNAALMAWFNDKFFEEASNPLVRADLQSAFMTRRWRGAPAAE